MKQIIQLTLLGTFLVMLVVLPVEVSVYMLYGKGFILGLILFCHLLGNIIVPVALISERNTLYEWIEEGKNREIKIAKKELEKTVLEQKKFKALMD